MRTYKEGSNFGKRKGGYFAKIEKRKQELRLKKAKARKKRKNKK